jgi:periplasmic copper chaperone A
MARPGNSWPPSAVYLSMKNRTFPGAVITLALLLGAASAAGAHVHASPDKVVSGATATVSFVIGHGCAGSPTTKVAIKVPSTVSKVAGVAPKGWKAAVAGSVVTFSGSTLPDKTKGLFGVSFVAPMKTGVLEFPTVQTCVKGETSWIQPTPANGKEPNYPIPTVLVTAKK